MGIRISWLLALALIVPETVVHAAPQQAAAQDPKACMEAVGLDAQMACLKKHIEGIQAMSDNAEPIEALPADAPRIIGDRSLHACYAKGQSQPAWPNGKPMGPTITVDECVENHDATQADFTRLCEGGLAMAQAAGPNNMVMRYLAQCPPAPKSKCSIKGLPREGSDLEDPASYTARLDYLYFPDSDKQVDSSDCTASTI